MVRKKEKRSWIVTVIATVRKEICCDDCAEEQAETDPYKHAVDESVLSEEIDKVLDVRPNE